MSEEFKSGFVSMMGRTNVGKSSIMNSLVEEKVAAIANKPQTTRNAIRAIVNREKLQIIFPVTSAFLSGWPNIINITQAAGGKPWPVLGGWSESLKLPITGLLPNAIKDGEGGTHNCVFQEISFVWFKNYF